MERSRIPASATQVRHCAILVATVLAGAALGCTVPVITADLLPAVAFTAAGGPVYTVTDLSHELARDPGPWLGQMVPVRAAVVSTLRWVRLSSGQQYIVLTGLHLIDPGARSAMTDIPLVQGPANPRLAALRRLPLVGRLVPPPQALHWSTPAVYRIQLRPLPDTTCSACVEAVLLDADRGNT